MKYSLRHSIDFPIVNFALAEENGAVRFFAGAAGPNVIELTETAAALSAPDADAEIVTALAVEELTKKAQIIRETGLSVQVKRNSFRMVDEIIRAFQASH